MICPEAFNDAARRGSHALAARKSRKSYSPPCGCRHLAPRQGAEGPIIDGGCRDVETLQQMDFPVFSRTINSKGTVKATIGSVNVSVACANALINPGVVIGDVDGVVIVVPVARAAEVAAAARTHEDNQEAKRRWLAPGELGLHIFPSTSRTQLPPPVVPDPRELVEGQSR
ncbi:hypothetical protein [Arthrobacter ipis]|uniref:RraA family protein n=1 Tax=Arthrobacter ipis TaxID=2716202 RepID=UPI00288AA9E2|nr:hypothetical protein [Arthrobacter ipis]